MRLLLRANSHRSEPDGGIEVAASPDTRERERWQWDVRLARHGVPALRPPPSEALGAVGELPLTDGGALQVMVRSAPEAAAPSVEILHVTSLRELRRQVQEVMILVSGGPGLLVEGRHLLGPVDALVLEGDDPFLVPIEAPGDLGSTVAVIRLQGRTALGWVP